MTHVRKIGGKCYRSFILDYGDVPVGRWNEITGRMEEVVNTRGKAYATRNHKAFRKRD